MIQISPQVSSSGEAGKTQDPEQSSLKKDKLGVFAKLLEGLIGKRKSANKAGAESAGMEEGAEETAEAPEAGGKAGAKGRKKVLPANPREGAVNPEEIPPVADFSPEPVLKTKEIFPAEEAGEALGVEKIALKGEGGENFLLSAGEEAYLAADPADVAAIQGQESLAAPGEDEFFLEAAEIARLFREESPENGLEPGEERPLIKKEEPFRGLGELIPDGRNGGEEAVRFAGTRRAAENGEGRENGQEGGRDRLAETRNARRRGERSAVQVQDLRSAGAGPEPEIAKTSPSLPGHESAEAELSVSLRYGGQEPEARSSAGIISAPGQAFEDLLARELHQNLNGDIVRHAAIILRDGGEGTIRLSLKPETLGNVKIRLEMADNKITGHIVVESNEALRAFEREVHSLEQAFRDSGFSSARLDMSLSSGNGWGNNGQWQGGEGAHPYTESLAASLYDTAGENAAYSEDGVLSAAVSGRETVNMLI